MSHPPTPSVPRPPGTARPPAVPHPPSLAPQTPAPEAGSGPQPSGPSIPLPPAPAVSDTPDLCGKPHTYKTRTGEEKAKPCLKARRHSGLCSSRQAGQKVDLSVISNAMPSLEDAPSDELLDVVTDRVRGPEQLKADADVALGHRKWIQAGKPGGINEAIKKGAASRYIVPPAHVAAVRTLLRRAENAPELKGKVHVRIPPVKSHVSGNKMIYFVVVDKKQKAETVPPTQAAPAPSASTSQPSQQTAADNK
jgi:hypothetical protein